MSETPTVPFTFKMVSMSPDPQNKTMRTNLEPNGSEILVRVNVPQTAECIDNVDLIITAQLSSDLDEPKPILTPAGLVKLYQLLSHPFTPQQEEVSDDEWGDAEDSSDDDGWDETEDNNDDDNNDDDDEGWED
jgi:hypothetical protein